MLFLIAIRVYTDSCCLGFLLAHSKWVTVPARQCGVGGAPSFLQGSLLSPTAPHRPKPGSHLRDAFRAARGTHLKTMKKEETLQQKPPAGRATLE